MMGIAFSSKCRAISAELGELMKTVIFSVTEKLCEGGYKIRIDGSDSRTMSCPLSGTNNREKT